MSKTEPTGILKRVVFLLLAFAVCTDVYAAWSDVRLDVEDSGMYYVSAADLATVIGETNAAVQGKILSGDVALYHSATQAVAYMPAVGGLGLYFYGEAIDSVYTRNNSYRLEWLSGAQMSQAVVGGPAAVDGGKFLDIVHFEDGQYTATSYFHDPEDDYWLWGLIMAEQVDFPDASFTNVIHGVSGVTNQAQLTVWLYGGMTQGITNEHHATVEINGTGVGGGNWTGLDGTNIVLHFDQSQLLEGTNIFKVTGVLDGAWDSIFYVDAFDLSYTRNYFAENDQLIVRGDANTVITIGEFSTSNIWVADISNPKSPVLQVGVNVEQTGSVYRVSFAPAAPSTEYVAFAAGMDPVKVAAIEDTGLKAVTNDAEFLVITPAEFLSVAESLVTHRRGKRITARTVVLEDIYDQFSNGIRNPNAIKAFLAYAYNNWSVPPKYVVLAGSGTFDYKDYLGNGDCIIPVMLIDMPLSLYSSDVWYGDVDGDDYLPEIMIGRLPAMTEAGLQKMVDRIIAYENAPMEAWQEKVVLLADNPDSDGDFYASSDRLEKIVPLHFMRDNIHVTVGTETNARNSLIADINDGALMVNYFGHSAMGTLTHDDVLTSADMPLLTNSTRLTILTSMSCDMGRFENPFADSLSEELMLCETGGTIAVWAPSGQAYNRSSELLCQGFYTAVFWHGKRIIGDAIKESMIVYNQSNMGKHLMLLYNLLGDPAMLIRGVSRQTDDPYSSPNEPFVDWKDNYFTEEQVDDLAVSGDYADPDGDGVSNLLEYLLGWNPLVANVPRILDLEKEPEDIGMEYDFVVQYHRSKWYYGLLAGVQISTDLSSTWQDGLPWIVHTKVVDDGNQETETVEYYMKSPSENSKYFVRFSAGKQ